MSNRLESFARAFSSCCSGSVRTCKCGRTFFDVGNHYDWEEGELEKLEKNKKASALDYSVSTLIINGDEYAVDCDCWHAKAKDIMRWLDNYAHQVCDWFTLEKKRKQTEADNSPIPK